MSYRSILVTFHGMKSTQIWNSIKVLNRFNC